MEILRIAGHARGRNRCVAHGGLVFAVATANHAGPDLNAQTTAALAHIEESLIEAGSDKTKLLQATVYVADISRKGEMDEVWCEWIGPDNWPQRACIGVDLAPNDLVEIVVVAAR